MSAPASRTRRWSRRPFFLLTSISFTLLLAACHGSRNPQADYQHARAAFIHGNLLVSQQESERGLQRYQHSPEWAWKFRELEAESLLWRGMYPEVVELLDREPSDAGAAIQFLTLRGAAYARLRQFSDSERSLGDANRACAQELMAECGALRRAQGVLATERRQIPEAEKSFQQSLAIARINHDNVLEATAMLNLGAVSLLDSRFDQAVDRSKAAYEIAHGLDAQDLEQNALGNLGWAYYRLGDAQRALDLFLQAESRAVKLGDLSDAAAWLTDAGYVYMDTQNLSAAEESFQRALELEQRVQSKEDIYNAKRILAVLSLQNGDTEKASSYASQALNIARESGNHIDELYPLLVEGQIAAQRHQVSNAQKLLREVEEDNSCPMFLKWEAQHSLARLLADHGQAGSADRDYRAAVSTFESARSAVTHEDFQLSFLTNGAGLYDDYIHFLVSQHKPDEALRWADFSRARALAEGLGMLRNDKRSTTDAYVTAPALDPQAIARRAKGALLFYWLGEKQSYLWAITSRTTRLFPLPARNEIEALVKRYRAALTGPQNVLESGGEDGQTLYRMLIAPTEALLTANERVFILPDGALNNLNFETLIVSAPKPHFWIEDADIVNASSLRVLDASLARPASKSRTLLLIGDSVAASKDYPELPKAADQMASVAHHFPSPAERVYKREQATPVSYLQSNLQQFSYVHFVAHGTASRLSPLDSAIVLSKDPSNPESFKLYARDIIHHPLRAELVTISACYGAGERQYSGEGLVGLAWAFLRAGARNVIAALWEVTDVSTDQLMDRFYDELSKGAPPDVALRAAKLSLLHSSAFSNPFYWAPFQLYRG